MAKNGYEDWDKKELIEEIKSLKKRKKFGLVWESKPEYVVEQCKEKFPVLEEVKSLEISIDDSKPTNLLIEGDNYHALSVLNYTHKGKIDVIYIDPPYNTGAKDWKYNNNFVDENDGYRHSKWLSMMANRLILAKRLLKRDGVLIVTIDDYELHSITQLLADLGGKSLGRVAICIKPEGRRQSSYIMESHEYILFVSWGKPDIRGLNVDFGLDFPEEDDMSKFKWEGLMRRDSGREDRGSDYWYPFYVNVNGELSTEKTSGAKEIFPINTKGIERVWLWDKNRAEQNLKELKHVKRTIQGKERITVYYKRRELGRIKPTSFWFGSKYNANAHGTRTLQGILPKSNFKYPKSIYAVLDSIDLFLPPNGTVLDFFAGSGTTGHAVSMLNKHDNGNRRFILCTNNENGIAREICQPRIKAVIKGQADYPDITGILSNLKYFKTTFVPSQPTDQNKKKLTQKVADMLCVRENTFEQVKSVDAYKIYRNKHRYTGIIYNEDKIENFKKVADKLKGHFSVYVFSLGNEDFEEEFADMKNKVKLQSIPDAVMRAYRRIFK